VIDVDGVEREVDVIILATGFQPTNYLAHLRVIRRDFGGRCRTSGRGSHEPCSASPCPLPEPLHCLRPRHQRRRDRVNARAPPRPALTALPNPPLTTGLPSAQHLLRADDGIRIRDPHLGKVILSSPGPRSNRSGGGQSLARPARYRPDPWTVQVWMRKGSGTRRVVTRRVRVVDEQSEGRPARRHLLRPGSGGPPPLPRPPDRRRARRC
jgi:hypothetical protein